MANISTELAAIQSAILGRDVRGSIHDAIFTINEVSEHYIDTGTADPTATPLYSGLKYINSNTWDVFESSASGTSFVWTKIGNIAGNSITSITGPEPHATDPLIDVYTINFSKASPITFEVANGRGIVRIDGPTTVGLIDTYTIVYNDGTSDTFDVTNGKGISSITGPTTSGLVDTYTINYNDGTSNTFDVTNGKDGNTVIRGNEVTGTATAPTQFTLTTDCQTGDTYINLSGNVYTCTSGAVANDPSLWKYDFTMAGGSGSQFLNDLSDVDADPTSLTGGEILKYDDTDNEWKAVQGIEGLDDLDDVDADPTSLVGGEILQYDNTTGEWKAAFGGSGHTLKPTPGVSATEAAVVTAVNSATNSNNEVTSLYGIQRWSNLKRTRVVSPAGAIGHYGIGEWQDFIAGTAPTAVQESGWGWWYNDAFKIPDGYNVDLDFLYDNSTGEPIMRGGYILDTTNGYLCIKFANYVVDIANAKVAVDITITRNDYS